jgi:hypothetical protein
LIFDTVGVSSGGARGGLSVGGLSGKIHRAWLDQMQHLQANEYHIRIAGCDSGGTAILALNIVKLHDIYTKTNI